MKKILNIKYFAFLLIILGMASCQKDDFTGHSKLTPSTPTLSVSGIDANGYSMVEGGQIFKFDVALSEPQIVDVKLYISQIEGDASAADYNVDGSIVIPAGSTTGTIKVEVLQDDLREDTETFKLRIGDGRTVNTSFTPVDVNFTIMNYTKGDLGIHMEWATDAKDAIQIDLDPTDAVDMRLLVTSEDGTIIGGADGGSFEDFILAEDVADGVYYVAADIFSTVNAGDFDSPLTIDLSLQFDQVGTINGQTFNFPAALTNEFACDEFRANLVKVTKAGGSYTLEKDYSTNSLGAADRGTYYGTDGHLLDPNDETVFDVLASNVVIDENTGFIKGLNKAWMEGFWGEEIIAEGEVKLIVSCGKVSIPSQYIFTTLYDGAEYPYTVSGSGTYDTSGDFPVLTINYVLDQDGFDPSGWAATNGYSKTPYFTAHISTDPDFFKGGNTSSNEFIGSVKPVNQ